MSGVQILNNHFAFITVRIRSDHNIDNSTEMLKEWLAAVTPMYHRVDVKLDEKKEGKPNRICKKKHELN